MTKNPGRWIVPDIGFHAGAVNWLLVAVTSMLLLAPWVAGQSAIFAPPGSFQFESSIRLSPTMTIVLVCLMGTIFLVACVIVYVRQFVDRRMSQSFTLGDDGVRRQGPRGLDPAVADSFPAFIYSDLKGLKIGKAALECAVCLNEFEDDETLRLLPQCNHVFHRDCVDTWLSSHITCPVCRANLNPKPGESLSVTVLSHDPESELDHRHTTYSPDFHEPQNRNLDLIVGDSIIPTQSPDLFDAIQTRNRNGSPRSTSRKEGATGRKLRRSCSTGESIVKAGENCEKFTLRLPEEVRNGLVRSGLSRTRSCCVAFPRARSLRKGYRSRSGGTGRGRSFYYEWFDQDWRFDRWEFMAAPPFFSRAASARSPTVISGGEKLTTPKNLLKSVTSPLYGLFGGTGKNEQGINVAETSFDRPRFGGLV